MSAGPADAAGAASSGVPPGKGGTGPGGRRAVAVWSIGVSVYFVAVIFRTSLGVAGLDAGERFAIGASALSAFSIVQLLVYAGMQIPVGLLVDRFGTKRVLILGAVLFTTGQLGFALAPSYGTALAARVLLGCGDAMTFISVLRLGSRWFPARRAPLMAQLAGFAGMAGNLVSTLLIARLLDGFGWAAAFGGSSLAGVVVLVLLLFLRDQPPRPSAPDRGEVPAPSATAPQPGVRGQLAAAWREPGTRLGLWAHFTGQFPAMVFLLLWGLPFLVRAQGLTPATAGNLLTLIVVSNMAIGLVYGQVIARCHAARLPLVLGTVAATATLWALTLAWPGERAPLALLVALCAVLGACGPASLIGFDFARPANPPERQGTASGIVNMGGFVSSMATLLAVGLLLDLTDGSFRVAFSAVFVFQALGVVQVLRLHRRAAHRERESHAASRVTTVHVPAA
ncbi:MFS transporter [Streptomyces sp. NPDC049906]|uniref:MFS transporter n=1 Tax=Streptomyces sp. NPDC049906 TaxID=3155656 RepID=UPI00344936D1